MGLQLIEASVEKVIPDSIAEAHLRRDSADDLTLIQLYRDAAVKAVENYLHRSLLVSDWLYTMDSFPCSYDRSAYGDVYLRRGEIVPPVMPFVSLTTLKYINTSGVLTTMAGADYQLDNTCKPARIMPPADDYWPEVKANTVNAVQIAFKAGYATPEAVPAPIKAGILLAMGSMYANREDVITGTISQQLPEVTERLLSPYIFRWPS